MVLQVFGTKVVNAEQRRELFVAKTRTVRLAKISHYDDIPFRESLLGPALYSAQKLSMQGNPLANTAVQGEQQVVADDLSSKDNGLSKEVDRLTINANDQ